ncbi:hypothetical protein FACS189487_06890 [Campylobacterota bacterium]|nr:hypothetical protein FACS189487_06890 [Campylobacterota bacterium]
MFDRITRKTAFYAVGGGVGAGVFEVVAELLRLNERGYESNIHLVAGMALWFGLVALGISLGLVAAQHIYLRQSPRIETLLKAVGIGLVSGAIAGGVAQILFGSLASGLVGLVRFVFQSFCWGLAGLGLGFGVSMFVPNYPRGRAILAGFAGGVIGGAVFLLLGIFGVMSEEVARVIGIAILGLAIGLTVSAVEEMLREAWLTVIWGKNETTSVALGEHPVILGSAPDATVRLPRSKFPPVTAVLTVQNGKVMMDNKLSNQTVALPNGSKINIGKITIVINTRKGGIDRRA